MKNKATRNKELIEILHKSRALHTLGEAHTFEDALDELTDSITPDDMEDVICKVLYYGQEGSVGRYLMRYVIRMLEKIEMPMEDYLRNVALYTPLTQEGRFWAQLINIRIMWHETMYGPYISVIQSLKTEEKEQLISLLEETKEEWCLKNINEKIDYLIKMVSSENKNEGYNMTNKGMQNKELIEILHESRAMSTDEEFEAFEDALAELAESITPDDLGDVICKVLYDDAEELSLMFTIIHMLETIKGMPDEDYLRGVALYTPLVQEGRDFAQIMNTRILNDEPSYEQYIPVIQSLKTEEKERLIPLLEEVKARDIEWFGEKVDRIIKMAFTE